MKMFSLLAAALLLLAATAPSKPDPERAMSDFLRAYWDADKGYFLAWNRGAPFSRPSGAGPEAGKYSDFWWEAQLWDLVMDAYERSPSPESRALIAAVYDGFVRVYPDWQNDFNDDLGWWAGAAARAYRLTGEARYLDRAKTLFADIWRYWNDDLGGGVLWRRSGANQKNVATNGPLTVTAVRLFQATGDTSYLEQARRLWTFVNEKLTDSGARVFDNWENGELRRWDFTYNFGNFVLASLALREVVPERSAELLARATRAADWALENLTNAGILLDEGGGDGGGFKGVMLRALRALHDAPGLEPAARTRYAAALRDNATQVWNSRREADGLVGTDWATPLGQGVVESLAAASAVAALQLAPAPMESGSLEARFISGDGRYEAENSAREGVNSSVTAAGYSGRGYINNFFKDGQFVRFAVNVAAPGQYRLSFRYSAGGGAARRQMLVNASSQSPVSQMLEFPATPDWQTWAEAGVVLTLPAGFSEVTLKFDRGAGSAGWLNLDRLRLQEAQ